MIALLSPGLPVWKVGNVRAGSVALEPDVDTTVMHLLTISDRYPVRGARWGRYGRQRQMKQRLRGLQPILR
jgi:hypothetical protein